ncbi:MAG: ATPase [Microbacteriaceae bacterium]|nr:ATPase [Microbacteriaceae bacterium]
MTGTFTAKAEITIGAPSAEVWQALTDPAIISSYYFGTRVTTDWKVGSPITWQGEWEGRKYEDKGVILEVEPGRLLSNSHFSPLGGQPDVPENYHTLTYVLEPHGPTTAVTLTQDNASSEEEAEHSRQMWETMLHGLKEVVEHGHQ